MKSMNSRDRVFAVLEGRIPDRVPTMELSVDGAVIDGIFPGMSYLDFVEQTDFYDVVTSLGGVVNPHTDWVDESTRTFRDKWGAMAQFTEEAIPHTIRPPRIETEEDFDSYVPPNPADPWILESIREIVRRFKDKKAIAFVGEDVFAAPQYLRAGPEELFVDIKLNPGLVKRMSRMAMEYHVELYRNVISEGVEIIVLGDDYGYNRGPLISPADFEEFFLPGLTTIVEEIKRSGAKVIKHSDGNIWPLIDKIVGTGVDMLGPLQLEASMDLASVKRRYPNRIGVMGNVEVDLLVRGTVDEVIEATKECIRNVSPGGRHILSSGNTITSVVPSKNLEAMIDTVHKYGRYPINL
jgi:uroporphyrinogen decarboxylase